MILLAESNKRLFTSVDNGESMQLADSTRRFFHLLPTVSLNSDHAFSLKRSDLRLWVTSDTLGSAVVPQGGIKVRVSFANRTYRVGGSRYTYQGWLIELPLDVTEADITMEWVFPTEFGGYRPTIRHHLTARFIGSATDGVYSDVFSMHPIFLTKGKHLAPISFHPYATLLEQRIQSNRNVWLGEDHTNLNTVIHEAIDLPAIRLSMLWDLSCLRQRVIVS